MEQEQHYLSILKGTTRYHLIGSQLWLRIDSGHALVYVVKTPGTGPNPIPESIIEKANQVVIHRVGEAFFREHFAFDPIGSRY
jgi:hypothetical protein